MSTSSVEKLRRRLALVDYFRNLFGVDDVHDPESVRSFYDSLNSVREGYDSQGRSYLYHFIRTRSSQELDEGRLLQYDENVRKHTEALNEHRSSPITFKPFQILALLVTEAYLDHSIGDPNRFVSDLNVFVKRHNEEHKGRIKYPTFTDEGLRKAAFWMATGSGKTLLMHVHYYQYLDYLEEYDREFPDNIILVTPREELSEQHIEEMRKSGVPSRHFHADSVDIFGAHPNAVKVIEITKLTDEATSGGVSIEADAFEGRNLVFVDEGHKGTGSEAQTWRDHREKIARDGFTFEYSATFGYGLKKAREIWDEYGRSILLDYSYPRFYDDGYGKDYHILNLESDVDPQLTRDYLLANLLTFYEQVHIFGQHPETYREIYNIARPLLVFIGHSVTAGRTRSQLRKNDEQTISDVEHLLEFLEKVLRNEDGTEQDWVPAAIERILDGEAGLTSEDGEDLFSDSFQALRDSGLSGSALYARMLKRLFNVDTPSGLELADIKDAEGEIGLRARASDDYFGVINIGNDSTFLELVEEKTDRIDIIKEQFADSLFTRVNQTGSQVDILLGSRKFIEGWDSWRVSTMGLMNFGRREGSQVIQLFGRGVRLLGKDQSLKRSSELKGSHPNRLPNLETLNIFGVRADYMQQFRGYLEEEGIETDPRKSVTIETERNDDFHDEDLIVVRSQSTTTFEESEKITLEADPALQPEIDLSAQVEAIRSGESAEQATTATGQAPLATLSAGAIGLIDWDEIYADLWKFRSSRGYSNLVAEKETMREIIEEELYKLHCPKHLLEIDSMGDLQTIQQIAEMILREYIQQFYTRNRRWFERRHLEYQPLEEELERDQSSFIDQYEAEVKVTAPELMDELQERLRDRSMWESDEGAPDRVHFDKHLYQPLLVKDPAEDPDVTYYPQGLNAGERNFIERLKQFTESGGAGLLGDWELFVLRNQTRGRGIGFLVGEHHDDRVFPDFILWLKNDDHQHIVFVDPHGMVYGPTVRNQPKVRLHDRVKEYEAELNERSRRADLSLHSYVMSTTSYADLKEITSFDDRTGFWEEGVFFEDDPLNLIFERVLKN